jgi:CBS domain containing-hemolysin-like protein
MFTFVVAVSTALVVSFLCSIFESVLLSIGPAQVESLVVRGRHAGRLLRDFKRNIDVPIAAILIINTIAHTIGASVAGATYEDVFSGDTLWIFTIVFTTAVLLFTEIIPKTLGVTHARRLASPVAYGIKGLTIFLKPLVLVSEKLSRAIRGPSSVPVTSIEEIRLLTALGRNEGVVGMRTADMIVSATKLRQLRAADVMIPRQRVTCLSSDMDREAVLEHIHATQFSRFPFVRGDDIDDVSGIVLTKELLLAMVDSPGAEIRWAALVREPLVVPESTSVNRLLQTFREGKMHLAIVVDEYGGFEGIVTIEDVLEELVGEIFDESDRPAEELRVLEDGSYEALATVEIRRMTEALGVESDPNVEAVSIGGLLAELLEEVPKEGDSVVWNGLRLEVVKANERRVEIVRVIRIAD